MPHRAISAFAIDSRQVRPGQGFVALKTEKRDGHDFLEAAQRAGAAMALVETPRPELSLAQLKVPDTLSAFQAIARAHRRSFRGPVVGVTGSAGKTSTKDLLAILLGGADRDDAGGDAGRAPVLATQGNLNNHLGVPLTLTRLDSDIHSHAVIEAGISAPGEMAPLASMIEPDIAIVTLVGPAHLRDLKTLDNVAREKSMLPAAVRDGGVAIFPQSCAGFSAFKELRVPAIRVGTGESSGGATEVVFSVKPGESSMEVALRGAELGEATFELPRMTEGMVQNAVLALAAARRLGVDRELLQERLRKWRPGALRGEIRHEQDRLVYLDCYNANPASMRDALAAFVSIAPADMPRAYIVGCMEELGDDAVRYHRELGMGIGLRPGDFLMVLGDHADEVKAGALGAGASPVQVVAPVCPPMVAARLERFRGALFIKGSRRYALEKLLMPSLAMRGLGVDAGAGAAH
jgi:UDP-N-acetylmuramoyl-tripeptide--D-alanyl-D-alanine ligase